uniref:Uncharacterized protein n=1 Tax=Opuntia streptacantha TaxID=393608 RepID=A0A7C9CX10_OPUST
MKEAVIQNLISEKQALDSEVKSLEAILKHIQHVFSEMIEDDKAFQIQVESKERYCMIHEVVDRIKDSRDDSRRWSESQPDVGGFPGYTAEIPEQNDEEFQAEESACSATQLACSGPQSMTNGQTVPGNDVKV